MYSQLTIAQKYLRYFFTASNGKGHGIHSPFVYEFVTNVLNDTSTDLWHKKIEALREKLKGDHRILNIEDLGAGSVKSTSQTRTVSHVAAHSSKTKKYGQLLHRIVKYYHTPNILELGTSLGLSTAYMASGNPQAKCISMEGSDALADLAEENFKKLGLDHIELLRGPFDRTLPTLLSTLPLREIDALGLVFIDGNHRLIPTLHYFDLLKPKISPDTILIFDDIHWSHEMEEAWEIIKNDPKTLLTIDLFFLGIVFFRTGFRARQHFEIRF